MYLDNGELTQLSPREIAELLEELERQERKTSSEIEETLKAFEKVGAQLIESQGEQDLLLELKQQLGHDKQCFPERLFKRSLDLSEEIPNLVELKKSLWSRLLVLQDLKKQTLLRLRQLKAFPQRAREILSDEERASLYSLDRKRALKRVRNNQSALQGSSLGVFSQWANVV